VAVNVSTVHQLDKIILKRSFNDGFTIFALVLVLVLKSESKTIFFMVLVSGYMLPIPQ